MRKNVLQTILDYNQINQDNIKIKLMQEDAFIFFRGTAELFFEHLSLFSKHPLLNNPKLNCWIQGDAHISNLGFFNKRCSSNPEICFDLNDFDEAFLANPFFDVIRFGVSISFFFDSINKNNLNLLYHDTFYIEYFLKQYAKFVSQEGKSSLKKEPAFMQKMAKKAQKRLRNSDEKSKMSKLVEREVNLFKQTDKLSRLDTYTYTLLKENIDALKRYEVLDLCKRKSAGVGSSHLERYYVLAKRLDTKAVILLEVKEQIPVVFLKYFNEYNNAFQTFKNPVHAHIKAKKIMLDEHDEHLHVLNFHNKHFIVKSIFNAKYSVDAEKFFDEQGSEEIFEKNLKAYLKTAALKLANAHKKSASEKNFSKQMQKSFDKHFYEIETIILKSYANMLLMYEHFLRDLQER